MNTSIEELATLANTALEMERSGLIKKMSQDEMDKFERSFPEAEMILGDFVILKRTNQPYA